MCRGNYRINIQMYSHIYMRPHGHICVCLCFALSAVLHERGRRGHSIMHVSMRNQYTYIYLHMCILRVLLFICVTRKAQLVHSVLRTTQYSVLCLLYPYISTLCAYFVACSFGQFRFCSTSTRHYPYPPLHTQASLTLHRPP